MQVEVGSPRVQERASSVEEKRPLLYRAGKETDGSNLRRRQVQGKVYIRRGGAARVVSCRKGARGEGGRPRREGR